MKKIYIKISGITCDNCKDKITKELLNISNVKNVNFDGHIAEVEYQGKLNKENIIKKITDLDYYTDSKMISENKKYLQKYMNLGEFLKIVTFIILISVILNTTFGFNIFNVIPTISSETTLAMLFVTGLLTSIHCVSMCGAINLMATTSNTKDFKKPILYNLGRLTSYTVIGGLVGLLGSVFKVNAYLQGIIIVIASIIMLIMVLNMLGVINISFKFKLPKLIEKLRTKGSFMIGLLNGLMPCGPLQAMQVYALSTGSMFYGALSMFLFCLGTIPLMLFMGMISNFLNNKNRRTLNKISTVLMLILSLIMLNRGMLSMGIDVFSPFKPNYDNYLKTEMVDDYQVIEFDLTYNGYKDIVVQKGIPVKMIINATKKSLTGCNNAIIISDFNINEELTVGQNIIEFTPTKTGTHTYTCWMNMLKNNIIVIDDMNIFMTK